MIHVDISQLIPEFLMNDHNGAALAKAIEKGMQLFCQTLQNGIDAVLCIDKMAEWRLDEMAWELGCLYDFDADIENKRAWIRDAVPLYASLGTQKAVYLYLSGYFNAVEVEENWQYGADAYHFRVTVSGEWTDKKELWAKHAIERTKNVRSVLDDLAIGSSVPIYLTGETWWKRFPYEMTDEYSRAGMRPYIAMIGKASDGFISAAGTAEGFKYPYEIAGTKPGENIIAATGEHKLFISSEGNGYIYPYPETGDEQKTGTKPSENIAAASSEGKMAISNESNGFVYPYPITGNEQETGTHPRENTVSGQGNAAATAFSDGAGAVFSYPQTGGNTLCGAEIL